MRNFWLEPGVGFLVCLPVVSCWALRIFFPLLLNVQLRIELLLVIVYGFFWIIYYNHLIYNTVINAGKGDQLI